MTKFFATRIRFCTDHEGSTDTLRDFLHADLAYVFPYASFESANADLGDELRAAIANNYDESHEFVVERNYTEKRGGGFWFRVLDEYGTAVDEGRACVTSVTVPN